MRSAQIALDLVGRSHLGSLGITACLAQRPTLAQQVPALVQLRFDPRQSRMFLIAADLAGPQPGAQVLLLGNQIVDPRQGVIVVSHATSVPGGAPTVK